MTTLDDVKLVVGSLNYQATSAFPRLMEAQNRGRSAMVTTMERAN